MRVLKIKNNVDLKELERFGFVKVKENTTTFSPCVKYWYTLNPGDEYDCVTIFKDREIYFGPDCISETYCIIYDLIKADLVEIVENE